MVESGKEGVKRDIPVNSKGWADLEEALRRNGLDEPQVRWCVIGEFPRAKRPQSIPSILSPGEVRRLLDAMSGVSARMAELLYGAGLRLAECASLRVRDLDFECGRMRRPGPAPAPAAHRLP